MKARSSSTTSCAKPYFDQHIVKLTTPHDYLQQHPTQQVAQPAASSWGEEGYWKVWLNERNEWILPHLDVAASAHDRAGAAKSRTPPALTARALKQAARELLLAQSSDWPFILRTGTSPEYAQAPREGSFAPLHRAARAAHADASGRERGSRRSSRGTICLRT